MGSIEPYSTGQGRRYRVRYRDPDRRSREKAGFRRRVDAEAFLASTTVAAAQGDFVDPMANKTTIAALGGEWLANLAHLKPSSLRPIEITWRLHVAPKWGARRVGEIQHSQVQTWVTEFSAGQGKPRSATTVARAYGILAGILDTAVKDKRIRSNPARGVNLPRKSKKARAYLNHQQVELLAQNSGRFDLLVRFLAYTGLRWGEATALRVQSLDFDRRRIRVHENAVDVGGQIVLGTTKSNESRSVPLPMFLEGELRSICQERASSSFLFGDGSKPLPRPQTTAGWFTYAVRRCMSQDTTFPRVTPHDLRHTAASLAISSGANVKAVQRMLGHASAAMTLDVYADLFDDDLDAVSEGMSAARTRALRRH